MAWRVRSDKVRKSQSRTLNQLASYVITVVAVTYAFSAVGYSLTYLFVGSTALLVGLGFGLQQMFMDVVSGIILLIDKNVNYGDVIRVDMQGIQAPMYGKITHIGLRTTLLETIDNEIMIVPNSRMLQSGVKSLMRGNGAARFRVTMRVSYDSDMELAKKLMMKAVDLNEKTDKDPKPTIIIKSFEDSYILLEIRFWMKEIFNSEIILSDIRFKIFELFKKEGLEIPYQQRIITEKK
jgi:small-conductance mechanosensitive channel